MPRNGAGVMSIPFPDFTPVTTIASSQADANNADIVAEITNSLPRDGQAGMSGQFKAADGSVAAPGISFGLDTNSGWFRSGADNIRLTLAGATVVDYTTAGAAITGTLSTSGGLTVSGALSAGSTFALTGDITPAQITATQHDYNPTGLSTASVLRLSSDASRDVTGLAGGADGRVLVVLNIGAQPIVLKDENAGSVAGNRFALSSDWTLRADESVVLIYDATSSRWRLAANSFNPTALPAETTIVKGDKALMVDVSETPNAANLATWEDVLGDVTNDLTEVTTIDKAADFLPVYDASASSARKVLPNNFPQPGGLLLAAWVIFSVAGTTVTVVSSYNVTSVVRSSTGNYTVTFTSAFADTNYLHQLSAQDNTSDDSPGPSFIVNFAEKASSTIDVSTRGVTQSSSNSHSLTDIQGEVCAYFYKVV